MNDGSSPLALVFMSRDPTAHDTGRLTFLTANQRPLTSAPRALYASL